MALTKLELLESFFSAWEESTKAQGLEKKGAYELLHQRAAAVRAFKPGDAPATPAPPVDPAVDEYRRLYFGVAAIAPVDTRDGAKPGQVTVAHG
jgi:hypothetical protein